MSNQTGIYKGVIETYVCIVCGKKIHLFQGTKMLHYGICTKVYRSALSAYKREVKKDLSK